MQLFHRPAGFHESASEIIEQFGMRGPIAELAEVARRADDGPAKVILTYAVDHDAGGQRVILGGDGVRGPEPAAALHEGSWLIAGQNLQETPRGLLARLVGVSAR